MHLSGYFGLGEFVADLYLDEQGSFRFLNSAIIAAGRQAPETICVTLGDRLASGIEVNASEGFDYPLFTFRAPDSEALQRSVTLDRACPRALESVPLAAMSVVPADADPNGPWAQVNDL